MLHIMSRLPSLADELMLAEAAAYRGTTSEQRGSDGASYGLDSASTNYGRSSTLGLFDDTIPASPHMHAQFMASIAPVFQRFLVRCMERTMERCEHDVAAMTRYVSWDFTSPAKDALQHVVSDPIHAALEARFTEAAAAREAAKAASSKRGRRRRGHADDEGDAELYERISSYDELVESFTETLMTRRVTERMRILMNDLVREVIRGWREEFCRSIKVKFNTGLVLPFVDTLPNFMRKEVAKYAEEIGLESDGGAGASVDGGVDERTSQLRERIEVGMKERSSLERVASRMRPRVGLPLKSGG
jgi:hypothetical protein